MNDLDPIQQYLSELTKSLLRDGRQSERILEEVEQHLRDRADCFRANGSENPEAEAVARFGSTERISRQFHLQVSNPSQEIIMIRLPLTLLITLVTAYAAAHVFFSFLNEPSAIETYVKTVYAVLVISYSLLVLYWQWKSTQIRDLVRWAIFLGGLGMIEIGTANMVWTAHLGLASGDWEYFGFVGGALISVLGTLPATWVALIEPREIPQTAAH